MTALNKQTLRQLATDAHELGIIKRYTKGIEANKRFVAIATPLDVLALLDELEAAEKQLANLFKENVRLKSGIAGLVHLGIRHGDIEVMRIAGDAQMVTPCTDSIIEKIAAGIGVKGE